MLAGQVWRSALSHRLKPLTAALADLARDDGSGIFASVAYLAWLVGIKERAVQYQLAQLRRLQIIVAESGARGGRLSTRYRMLSGNLPARAAWSEAIARGATSCTPNDRKLHPRGETSCTPGVHAVAPDPLVDPLVDPLDTARANLLTRKQNRRAPWQNVGRNHFARSPGPNRLQRAVAMIDQEIDSKQISYDQALAELRTRPEFQDQRPGENFVGLVGFYLKQTRAVKLA